MNEQNGKRPGGLAALTLAVAGFFGVAVGGSAAEAQSAYGCSGLLESSVIPSVEGAEGQFFAVDPDLRMHLSYADRTVAQIATLSDRLAAGGTRLIHVPMPTKAQVLTDHLPPLARHLGYDAALSTSVYDESRLRLEAAGVRSVDARRALRAAALAGVAPYFGPDRRLDIPGVRALAAAIAAQMQDDPDYEAMPKTAYRTVPGAVGPLPSRMARQLQDHCSAALPGLELPGFDTVPAIGQQAQPLFPGAVPPGRIVLTGADAALDPALNLAGFLAEASGLNVETHRVAGDTGLAALTDLLLSDGFARSRPAYLVWVHPMADSLARFGDAPMQRLAAAAAMDCQTALPVLPSETPNGWRADLQTVAVQGAVTLLVDADGALARKARFDFTGAEGLVRSRSIHRLSTQDGTARFMMPMVGLWPEGAISVDVVLDVPFGPAPRILACRQAG
nr:hypothetical protein [Cognatishimia sp. F0-27]